jgi:AMP phosphorylase
MELKIKLLKWSAGLPVAMIDIKTAEKIGIHAGDRISIKTISKKTKEFSTIVDLVQGTIKKNELGVSSEIVKRLSLKNKEKIDVSLAEHPRSLDFIKDKLKNKKLSEKQIQEIMEDIVDNSLSEPEIALFISAMYQNGMDFKETIALIQSILNSGNTIKLNKKIIVDKHSIGGVPGNRTTPLVVAICAAAGLTIPKSSSRAITSAAGTADVIETIAKIEFSRDELKKIIEKTNACMVWGGSLGLVPADSRIIKVEKMLKIDPKAQLLASIFSKKLAMGSNVQSKFILIDIPYGRGAKVSKQHGLELKKDFEKLGKYFKKKVKVVLTNGSQPIGNGIGPVLELIDLIKVFDTKLEGPKDLEEKSLFLAGELLEMSGKAKKKKGYEMARDILYSGKAFEKFKEIIKAQKGKLDNLNPGKYKKDIFSKKSGKIKLIENKKTNQLARAAGCPLDKSSGVYLYVHVGDKVKKKDKLLTIYAESKSRLRGAIKFYKQEKPIKIV